MCFLLFTMTEIGAQSAARTGYFMENATHRHLMNPALVPNRGYISFPAAGELTLGLESNMQLTNFLYPPEEGNELLTFLHKDVPAETFLSNLHETNFLRTSFRTSLLSVGFYHGTDFWTIDLSARAYLSLYLPYELFSFLKLGMTSSEGNLYQIRNLKVGSSLFLETAVGYSHQLSDQLRIGGKIKGLTGGAYVLANIATMDIQMTPDLWTITTDGYFDVYGKGINLTENEDGNVDGADIKSPGPGGSGAGLDIGATYSMLPNLTLSLAIVDLGAIRWKKDLIHRAEASGQTSFSGINDFGLDSVGEEDAKDQLETIKDDLTEMASFKQVQNDKSAWQRLVPTLHAGVEYVPLSALSIGALYSGQFENEGTFSELTASLNFKPVSWFNLSGSYSFVHGKRETVGFAIGFMPAILNLFLACDYTIFKVTKQYIPLNTLTTNFQLGISIPIGKSRTANTF
jgi:hypothetical protein